jgi:hypothetical protein
VNYKNGAVYKWADKKTMDVIPPVSWKPGQLEQEVPYIRFVEVDKTEIRNGEKVLVIDVGDEHYSLQEWQVQAMIEWLGERYAHNDNKKESTETSG